MGLYGVRWDPVGQLYDMRARWYDPETARFLSRDPQPPELYVPQTLNPYAYAVQNPLRYVDPLGLEVGGMPWHMQAQPMREAIVKWLLMLWRQGERDRVTHVLMNTPEPLLAKLLDALPNGVARAMSWHYGSMDAPLDGDASGQESYRAIDPRTAYQYYYDEDPLPWVLPVEDVRLPRDDDYQFSIGLEYIYADSREAPVGKPILLGLRRSRPQMYTIR
jgi:RHS repeat-associated protein